MPCARAAPAAVVISWAALVYPATVRSGSSIHGFTMYVWPSVAASSRVRDQLPRMSCMLLCEDRARTPWRSNIARISLAEVLWRPASSTSRYPIAATAAIVPSTSLSIRCRTPYSWRPRWPNRSFRIARGRTRADGPSTTPAANMPPALRRNSRRPWCTVSSVGERLTPRVAQQTQDFQVEPHQRHEQREPAVPFHVLGGALLRAALDHVEIEDEVERRDAGEHHAQTNAQRTVAPQNGHRHVEQAEHDREHVEHRDAERRRDHEAAEHRRGADDAGLVGEQHA